MSDLYMELFEKYTEILQPIRIQILVQWQRLTFLPLN